MRERGRGRKERGERVYGRRVCVCQRDYMCERERERERVNERNRECVCDRETQGHNTYKRVRGESVWLRGKVCV